MTALGDRIRSAFNFFMRDNVNQGVNDGIAWRPQKPDGRAAGEAVAAAIDKLLDGTDPTTLQGQITALVASIAALQTAVAADGGGYYANSAAGQSDGGLSTGALFAVAPADDENGAFEIWQKGASSPTLISTAASAGALTAILAQLDDLLAALVAFPKLLVEQPRTISGNVGFPTLTAYLVGPVIGTDIQPGDVIGWWGSQLRAPDLSTTKARLKVYYRSSSIGESNSAPPISGDTLIATVTRNISDQGAVIPGGLEAEMIWPLTPYTVPNDVGGAIIGMYEFLDVSDEPLEITPALTTDTAGLTLRPQQGWRRNGESYSSLGDGFAPCYRIYTTGRAETGIPTVLGFGASVIGADSTAAFAAAAAANETVYVPPGRFDVTSLTYGCFYGDGQVYLNGVLIPLPRSAREAGQVKAVRAKLWETINSGGSVALIGDSIAEHIGASDIEKSAFSQMQKALTFDIAFGTQPEETNFQDEAYGFTFTGGLPIFGTAGPIANSTILPDGVTMTLPAGTLDKLVVGYQKAPGRGSLLVKRDSTTLATIDTNAAAAEIRQEVATGGAGTYALVASGGAVEITGLERLRNIAGTAKPLFFSRLALAGQPTTTFTPDAVLASITAHAQRGSASAVPLYIVALGPNNIFNLSSHTTPAVYEADMDKIIARLLQTGYVITWQGYGWDLAENDVQESGYKVEDYAAALQRVCARYGVPVLRLDSIDFLGRAYLNEDGAHPNDEGQAAIFRAQMDMLSSAAFDPGVQRGPNASIAYTPTLSWSGGGSGWAGTFQGRYWRQGPRCKALIDVTLSAAVTPSGSLQVSLPFAADNAGGSIGFAHAAGTGRIGRATGVTASSGKQWVVEVAPGASVATLKCIDPTAGTVSDVTGLSNSAVITLEVDYVVRL